MKFLFFVFLSVSAFAHSDLSSMAKKADELRKLRGAGRGTETDAILWKINEIADKLEAKNQATYLTPQNIKIVSVISGVLVAYIIGNGMVAYRRLEL